MVSALSIEGIPTRTSAFPMSSSSRRASSGNALLSPTGVALLPVGSIRASPREVRPRCASPRWLHRGSPSRRVGTEGSSGSSPSSPTKANLEYAFEEAPGPAFNNSIWHDTVHQALVHRDPSRFDLIHQHSYWSGMVAALNLEVPVVHTLHRALTPQMRRVYEPVADRLWFVALSEAQRSTMPELRYAGTVHNGIDPSMYPLRKDKEDFLLFLGRTNPDKGALRAVEAARASGMALVMSVKMAEPVEEDHFKEEIEPALWERVTVILEAPHDEKVDLLGRARAVLFPIDWEEPFGLVMVEAMCSGTPVIATPRGAVSEVI